MKTEEHYEEILRKKGYRLTPQRLAILEILQNANTHLSPQDVFEMARKKVPGVTEPTVYRTLSFLNDEGVLVSSRKGSGTLVYELASNLHHHLVCRECGHSLEIEHEAMEDLYSSLKRQTGYALDDRHVTLFGLCPSCQ